MFIPLEHLIQLWHQSCKNHDFAPKLLTCRCSFRFHGRFQSGRLGILQGWFHRSQRSRRGKGTWMVVVISLAYVSSLGLDYCELCMILTLDTELDILGAGCLFATATPICNVAQVAADWIHQPDMEVYDVYDSPPEMVVLSSSFWQRVVWLGV